MTFTTANSSTRPHQHLLHPLPLLRSTSDFICASFSLHLPVTYRFHNAKHLFSRKPNRRNKLRQLFFLFFHSPYDSFVSFAIWLQVLVITEMAITVAEPLSIALAKSPSTQIPRVLLLNPSPWTVLVSVKAHLLLSAPPRTMLEVWYFFF